MKEKFNGAFRTIFTLILLGTIVLAACAPAPAVEAPAEAPAEEAPAEEAPAEEAPAEGYKILAVEKTLINEHWQVMQQGYEFAAASFGVTVDVISVPTEDDTAGQLAAVEAALAKGYDAICVSPITSSNLNPALVAATEKGIPIINVDELIPADVAKDAGIGIAARIASNNYNAGVMAANYMLDNLPAGSEVVVIEGMAGNSSGEARRDGFVDTVTAGGFEVVASQPADWDRAIANDVTTNILQANPEVKGIYYANDTMALGGMEAVEAAGLAGEIILLGTDAIPEAQQAVADGHLMGTVAQFPFEMGVLCVESVIKVLEGRPIAGQIESPVKLLLKADVEAGMAAAPAEKPDAYKILAVEKTLINEHWQVMQQGYEFAAASFGVTVDVISVPTEDDTAGQLAAVEAALAKGYDAICVSPITSSNLNPALVAATEKGIPIINVDELIPADVAKDAGIGIAARIASNNYNAGVMAANYMLDNLPAGSEVVVIEGMAGNSSGEARRDGFVDTVTAGGFEVVASQPADWDRAIANDVTTNILQANPEVKGIYYANDTMALGGMEAVEAAGLAGEIILLGTDAIPEAQQAVADGHLMGTVAQFPFEMGVLCVESVIKVLEGRPIAGQIESPVKLLLMDDVK